MKAHIVNKQSVKLFWFLIAVCYMVFLVYISIRPPSKSEGTSSLTQMVHNLLHIPAYGLLTYLWLQYFLSSAGHLRIWSFFIAVILGAFNEFLQIFVPNRFASFQDIFLNAVGAGVMFFLWQKFFSKKTSGEAI